jgi:murein DD-endopeptidase MepM/ murein hydrolase activator NlpD
MYRAKMIKHSALFILSAIVISRVSSAEVWSKILDSPTYTAIENTAVGVIAGEFDTRTELNPYNGLAISKNSGSTWNSFGLSQRGITDIDSGGIRIYVTTFYNHQNTNGLFVSNDGGTNWQQKGPAVSTSTVSVNEENVYLGTFDHGLWVSRDNGQNFIQKIGDGFFGSTIVAIETYENVVVATTEDKTYVSHDNAETWEESIYLKGKPIKYIAIIPDKIFVGTANADGLYMSEDGGTTWYHERNFGTLAVVGLGYYNNTLYAGAYQRAVKVFSIYTSTDFGKTWTNTKLNIFSLTVPSVKLSMVYGQESFLTAAVAGFGVYRIGVAETPPEVFRFLKVPWKTDNTSDLIDKVSAFFDHKYPLLGYNKAFEPSGSRNTTLNFLGVEAPEPELYYSSHSGIDFALPYGTEVVAPAAGMAEFYKCADCGNSIKIDHLNGYQTTYMHLQKDGLITTSERVPVFVGDRIGKIGMTGNTSGPHLHFEVTKDANSSGSFIDDFPHGRVDPFGWSNIEKDDPWDGYIWTDVYGQHTGQASKYLWTTTIPQVEKMLNPNSTNSPINHENKVFNLDDLSASIPLNFEYKAYSEPQLPKEQQHLAYISGTSFFIEILDNARNKITQLDGRIKIVIDISKTNLDNIYKDSIQLFYFNPVAQLWEALSSSIDLTTNTLTAETTHLSQFAAFATRIDTSPPVSVINISGSTLNGWYSEYPVVTLHSNDADLNKIFYSIENDIWEEYVAPFEIKKDDVVILKYRAVDSNNNYEPTNERSVKINTNNNWKKKLKINEAIVTTQSMY